MNSKLHNAWVVLAALWLAIAPSPAHATHSFRQEAVSLGDASLHGKTAFVARPSAAGCSNPYTVRKGDTLAKIARRCGVSVAALKKLNRLSGNTIWVGQVLLIRAPAGSSPRVAPAPTPTIESAVSPW